LPQPVLLKYNEVDILRFQVTSTEVITKGDLLRNTAAADTTSGYVYLIDAATNQLSFVGLALDSSADGDTDDIAVVVKGIAEIDATTASYRVPDGLVWTSSNTVVDDGGVNTLGWVAEGTGSASRIKFMFDARILSGAFGNNP